MKTAFLSLAGFLAFSGSLSGAALARTDLLGIPWGTDLASIQVRYKLVPRGSDSIFTRYAADIHSIDRASVEECILEFRDGILVGVALFTRGATNTHNLLAHLEGLFGPGRSPEVRGSQWLSPSTHLFYDEDTDGNGYVYGYARELLADLDPDRPQFWRRR